MVVFPISGVRPCFLKCVSPLVVKTISFIICHEMIAHSLASKLSHTLRKKLININVCVYV